MLSGRLQRTQKGAFDHIHWRKARVRSSAGCIGKFDEPKVLKFALDRSSNYEIVRYRAAASLPSSNANIGRSI